MKNMKTADIHLLKKYNVNFIYSHYMLRNEDSFFHFTHSSSG